MQELIHGLVTLAVYACVCLSTTCACACIICCYLFVGRCVVCNLFDIHGLPLDGSAEEQNQERQRERGDLYVYIYTDEYIMHVCIYNTHDAHTHTHLNTHSRRWTGQGEVRRPRCRTFEAWGTNQEFCSLRNVVRCESTQVLRCWILLNSVSKCCSI